MANRATVAPPVRTQVLIPLAALLSAGLLLPSLALDAQAEGRANRSDVMSVKDIKKGMRGYGLTVFEGHEPERFGVEVIDILQGFKPRQELILVKTEHPRLDVAKIVGGMSGSPIYIGGKMVGAYAYGWTFGVEPVAGVTPIRNMLDDLERPLPAMLHGLPLGIAPKHQAKPAVTTGRYNGELSEYSVDKHAAQLAARSPFALHNSASAAPSLTPVSTPLLVGGLSGDAVELLGKYLEPLGLMPVQAGGTGASGSAGSGNGFVDGGALGVNLVSGDVSAMGLGTVTRVEGQRLVAFGHPMMETGITALPTTEARVLWFMASQMRSFKMGEATYSNGALVNDRQSSIVVDQAAQAPVVNVELHIKGEPGAPYTDWKFQVAHDRFLTPSLLGVAIGNGLTAAAAERRDVTWSMQTVLEFDGYPPISIYDLGSAPTGTPQAAQVMQSDAMDAVGMVFNNPWQYARLTNVRVEVELKFAREVARLRGVRLLTPEVNPGGEARIQLTLEPFDGKTFSQVVKVPVPAKFAGQELKIQIKPGYMVEPPSAAPENLADLIANLAVQPSDPRSIAFSYSSAEAGAAYRGVVAENLPPGAMDRLASVSSSVSPEAFRAQEHHIVKSPLYLIGADSVEVQVRPEAR